MTDAKKLRLLVFLAAALCFLVISSNILQEYLLPDLEGFIRRRLYYERVITKKGLDLHRAMHWREKE